MVHMSINKKPIYVGSIVCPVTIVGPSPEEFEKLIASADESRLNAGILFIPEGFTPPTEESDKEFIEQFMEEISKPLDPDAPNTGCIH